MTTIGYKYRIPFMQTKERTPISDKALNAYLQLPEEYIFPPSEEVDELIRLNEWHRDHGFHVDPNYLNDLKTKRGYRKYRYTEYSPENPIDQPDVYQESERVAGQETIGGNFVSLGQVLSVENQVAVEVIPSSNQIPLRLPGNRLSSAISSLIHFFR